MSALFKPRFLPLQTLILLAMTVSVALVSDWGEADAAIHEKIAAACRAGGEEVVPPGQVKDGNSFLRALQATGIIQSIEEGVGDGDDVRITFDLSKPSSKYMASPGGDLTIPDAFGPGVDLTLSPLPILNPDFPAHAHCRNLNP